MPSEESREVPPDGDVPPDDAQPREDAPRLERRDALRRAAEVAAMSLFGIGSLEPLIERVLARMGELTGARALAGSIAHHLKDSGVIGVAEAQTVSTPECPSGYAPEGGEEPWQPAPDQPPACPSIPRYYCPDRFRCTQAQAFACRFETDQFKCVWGDYFNCQWSVQQFYCNPNFTCPPWAGQPGQPAVGWFHCIAPGEGGPVNFDCTFPTGFACGGGDGSYYLCPGVNQFGQGCVKPDPWDCVAGQYGYCASLKSCGDVEDYSCRVNENATAAFRCAPEEVSYFFCGGPQHSFSCDDTTVIDFFCRGLFECCAQGGQVFECNSNHRFGCLVAQFVCGAQKFICSAGGDRCNVGPTGWYNWDAPGDFDCTWLEGAAFQCTHTFDCAAADDFGCGYGTLFTCVGRFAGCHPGPGGNFECCFVGFVCNQSGQGETFNCGQADHNCATDGRQFSNIDV